MGWRMVTVATTAALGGCAGKPAAVAITAAAPASTATIIAPTPINAGLSPAATLWHLRTGLNVAALACRGPEAAALVGRYNAMLADRQAALAAADAGYRAEYQAKGGDWRDRYDDDQTRLYNFWSGARGREALCTAASDALAAVAAADGATLSEVAAVELRRLDRPFAPPRLDVDARVLAGPAKVMVALR